VTLYLVVPALFLVAVVQASAMPHLRIWGVFPDLPLLFVVSWGLLCGTRAGFIWGLIAGMFLDLLSGTPAGATTVSLAAVGLLAGFAQRSAFRAQLLLPIVVTVVSTTLYDLMLLLAMLLAGRTVLWIESLGRIILPSAILNLLLLPIVYFLLRGLYRRFGHQEMEW
jgi:rod shape-determining protein MreD